MPYESINPYDGKLLELFKEHTDKELEAAVSTAATCFTMWRQKSFAERAAVTAKAAARPVLASTSSRARSRSRWASASTRRGAKLMLSADIVDYYANHAERFLAPETLHPGSGEAVIESSPIGVLFGVEPWNFPDYQLARFAAPNIMAGNVVMVKHAECVPQCAIAFEKLWLEAGAPAGVYTNLRISHDQVARVIADPRIKGVALTGGTLAGKSLPLQRAET